MAERDGHDNLIPQNRRTKDEQRLIASQGGKKSAEARRARKTLREELLALLKTDDRQNKMSLALIERAMRGDTKAFEVIRDSIGEKPVDRVENTQDKPFEVIVTVINNDGNKGK